MIKAKDLIIYGAGDFARLAKKIFEEDGVINVLAFVVDKEFINIDYLDDIPVLSFEQALNIFPPNNFLMFVAVGYASMRNRVTMFNKAKKHSYQLFNYISSKAIFYKNFDFGENNIIFPGVVIEPSVKMGNNNVIWSSVNICHDVTIGDHNFIAARSLLGGRSCIKDNCFIGFNSTILHNVTVLDESLVAANSLLLKDTEKFSKNMGTPSIIKGFHYEEGIVLK